MCVCVCVCVLEELLFAVSHSHILLHLKLFLYRRVIVFPLHSQSFKLSQRSKHIFNLLVNIF